LWTRKRGCQSSMAAKQRWSRKAITWSELDVLDRRHLCGTCA
jgi:hypothetical protein